MRLNADVVQVDLWDFDTALASERWEDAISLHRGQFLPGAEYPRNRELGAWLEATRERVDQGLRLALQRLCESAIASADVRSAIEYAERLTDTFPLDDGAHELFLRALIEAGRPGEAVRVFEAYRITLKVEIDDEPSTELREIAEEARRQVKRGKATATPTAVVAVDAPTSRAKPEATVADRPKRLRRVHVLIGICVAVIVVGFGVSSLRTDVQPGPANPAILRVKTADGGRELAFSGATPDGLIETGAYDYYSLVSPGGTLVARRLRTPSGRRIEIVQRDTDERLATVPVPDNADQHEHAWSPDSKRLLYVAGFQTAEGAFARRLYVFNLESGEEQRLGDLVASDLTTADWSPAGTRIVVAVEDGASTDLFLVDADGKQAIPLTRTSYDETDPRWSPDGSRIVFVTYESGSPDLAVMNADGSQKRIVLASGWTESSPAWLDNSRIVYIADRNGQKDLWVENADTADEPIRVTRTGGFERIDGVTNIERAGMLAAVEITAAFNSVSPGEVVPLAVQLFGDSAEQLPPTAFPVQWEILESDRDSLTHDGGTLLHVLDVGQIRVVADVAGWRADTVTFCSRPLVVVDSPVLLEDDWSQGIRQGVWSPFGSPAPTTRSGGGPEAGGVLINNGDESYNSGVVSVGRFPTRNGLTVEVWARLPLTANLYQSIRLGLVQSPAISPDDGERYEDRFLALVQFGRIAAGGTLGTYRTEVRTGLPPRHDTWRLHALQLHPDGQIDWIIDGQRWVASRVAEPLPDSVHVVLHGRSLGTEAAHGVVRVRTGIRYVAEGECS